MGGAVATSKQALSQIAAMDREVATETARLTALLAGQSRTAADVAAKYTLMRPAEQAHLVALKEQVQAQLAAAAAAEKAKTALEKEAVTLRQFGTAATQAGRSLTLGISVPLIAIGAAALKSSLDIQKAMNTIRQETGATGATLANLGKSFQNVATSVPQSMGEVASAMALVSQRTHLTGGALESLTTQALNLSRVTGQSVNPLITASTKIFQQWGVTAGQQKEALNQLYRAHQATGIGVQELMDKVLKFGGAFKTAGLSLVESEALLAAFNQQGIVGDKALTALNTTFAKWAKAGITDAHGALVNLIAAVKAAPTPFAALKIAVEAGMAGKTGTDFVNAVRSGGTEMKKLLEIISGGKETINKAAADTLDLGLQFDLLKRKVEFAIKPLGDWIAKDLHALGVKLDEETPKIKAFGDAFSKQSGRAKDAELAVGGIAIAIPPVIFGLGKLATSWANIQVIWKAGAEVMKKALLAALAPPVAAIAALTAVFLAIATNWNGTADYLKAGGIVIADTFKNLTESISTLFSNLWEDVKGGLDGLLARAQVSLGLFGGQVATSFQRAQATAAAEVENRRLLAAQGPATAEAQARIAVGSSGMGQLHAIDQPGTGRRPPVLPSAGHVTRGLGGGDPNAAPNVKAETEGHRLLMEALRAEAKAQEILNLMKDKYTKHQAEIISRYTAVNEGALKNAEATHRTVAVISLHTEALDAQAEKLDKLAKANAKATHDAKMLDAQAAAIRQQLAGGPATRVPQAEEKEAGADAAHKRAVALSQHAVDAGKAELKLREEAAAKIVTLGKQIDSALAADQVAMGKAAGETTEEAKALEMYTKALATGRQPLIDNALAHMANVVAIGQHKEEQKALQVQFNEDMKVVGAIMAAELRHQQVQDQLAGEGKQLTEVQKGLNMAYASGDPFLIAWAEAAAAAAAADDKLLATHKLMTEIMAGYTREVERGLQQSEAALGMSHETAVATVKLAEAFKNGSEDAIMFAAVTLKMAQAHDVAALAIKETAKEQKAFEKQLDRVRQSMSGMFERGFADMMKGGFKNFFKTILGDLDSLLLQMAEKIAAAKLTEAIMGSASVTDAAGNSTGGGKGGLLGFLGSLIPGLFGGGGAAGVGAAGDVAAAGLSASAGAALTMPLPAFASGGSMFAGQAGIVGERGPEFWRPDRSGTITPHGQTPAGGGMTVHQTFNISTPDVAGFKKSQTQLMADSLRLAQAHQLRNGS